MVQAHAKRSILSSLIAVLGNYRAYLALLLGTSFGVLVYSYWLVDHLPPISKQAIFYAVLASLVGIAGHFLLLERYVAPRLVQMSKASRWGLLLGSFVIGVYLTFAYLSAPNSLSKYITFLLPREHLRIVVSDQNAAEDRIAILRFTTSLGDVSYNTIKYQGWTRSGSDLVLSDPARNTLEWTGRTGAAALITFRTSHPGGTAKVFWNSEVQIVSIAAGADGRYQLGHSFAVPFYASQITLLILGILNFMMLCWAVNILIWDRRTLILGSLERSVSDLFHPDEGGVEKSGERSRAGQIIQHREWVPVACLLALALLLRVFKLSNLYPYADEYSHLLAARALLEGAPWNSVFDRSLLIVTLPVAVSLRLFGNELWAARLPGALFNALAIIPLYLLTRKINKPIAVLSGLLYASSPLLIALGRNVREYAYYPFYFYWVVYAMVLFLEQVPGGLILFRDWKRVFQPNLRILSLALIVVPLYAVFIDARSTFKIIMIAYAVFGLFLLRKSDLKSKTNLLFLGILGTCLVVAGSAYAAAFGHSALSVIPNFHIDSLAVFFPNPPQQWYFDRPVLIPAFALLVAGVICLRTFRLQLVPSFLGALLVASAVFFTTFFGHYFKPRYLTLMELWFVCFLALGLYGLFAMQLKLPRNDIVLPLTATALFALIFNISQTLLPTLYDKQGNMPVTTEYHYNLGPAQTFLRDKVQAQDVLISSIYAGYVRWKGVPSFRKIYSYGFTLFALQYKWIFPYEAAETLSVKPRDYVLSIVEENNSGWIVLDSINYASTLSKPLPLKTTVVNDKAIDYRGYFGGEYIWQWHEVRPSP